MLVRLLNSMNLTVPIVGSVLFVGLCFILDPVISQQVAPLPKIEMAPEKLTTATALAATTGLSCESLTLTGLFDDVMNITGLTIDIPSGLYRRSPRPKKAEDIQVTLWTKDGRQWAARWVEVKPQK